MNRPGVPAFILGIEGGGTHTSWALYQNGDRDGRAERQGEAGPGNTLLLDDPALNQLFQTVRSQVGDGVGAIGGAFAGCHLPAERARVEARLRATWPDVATVRVVEDSSSALAAAFGVEAGIVVIAGTGANVVGQAAGSAQLEKAGGWGHLFADRGSAYDLARRGLEAVYASYDADRKISRLGRHYLAWSGQTSLEELVSHLLSDSSKARVAAAATCVFLAAAEGDRVARRLLVEAAAALAQNVVQVARRLKLTSPGVALSGGLFEHQPGYCRLVTRAVRARLPRAKPFVLKVAGTYGAARRAGLITDLTSSQTEVIAGGSDGPPATAPIADATRLAAFAQAATEQRNPRSRGLDRRTVSELVELFIREERWVDRALHAEREAIARAATLVADRLAAGGRLFYLGAGTSGRLGVVDASEMPPTFNAPPEQVQAIMAGGPAAVFRSQEGAEDDAAGAGPELRRRGLSDGDVVCGIAASGQTPFVLGGLAEARALGAATILLTCNPKRSIRTPVDVEIDLPTGPELVTGSTRLKAGTATKLVLNMLSTIAMVRLGRVRDNLMINVQATNDKLKARAVRLVQTLADCDFAAAEAALRHEKWDVAAATARLANPTESATGPRSQRRLPRG